MEKTYKNLVNLIEKIFFYYFIKENFDIANSSYFGYDTSSRTLFIKSIPSNVSKWEIKEIIGKLAGFESISLS